MNVGTTIQQMINRSFRNFESARYFLDWNAFFAPLNSFQGLRVGEFAPTVIVTAWRVFWFRVLAVAKSICTSAFLNRISSVGDAVSNVKARWIHAPRLITGMAYKQWRWIVSKGNNERQPMSIDHLAFDFDDSVRPWGFVEGTKPAMALSVWPLPGSSVYLGVKALANVSRDDVRIDWFWFSVSHLVQASLPR
jgi:hypothetical protein